MKSLSCVTVTRGRFERWIHSLEDFLRQDYSCRELVVLVDRDEEGYANISRYLRLREIENVRAYLSTDSIPLGELRNRAVALTEGEIICQWDDDDLYHPARLSRQLNAMDKAAAAASYLQEHFGLVESSGDLFWCDWIRTRELGMPSTLMAYKKDLPKYAAIRTHEDSYLQRTLQKAGAAVSIEGMPGLHIYVEHGSNVSGDGHLQAVFRLYGLERATLIERKAEVLAWLEAYPELTRLTVRSYRGEVAFQGGADLACPVPRQSYAVLAARESSVC